MNTAENTRTYGYSEQKDKVLKRLARVEG